jgi:hypothetical protein
MEENGKYNSVRRKMQKHIIGGKYNRKHCET